MLDWGVFDFHFGDGGYFMLKILGILILLGALFVVLVGAGGAVMNLVFPPQELTCQFADESAKKVDEAKKKYDAAKGTPSESEAKSALDAALHEFQADTDSCGHSKESHRFYGIIFSVVAVLGVLGVLFGGLLTLLGFRRKKTA